MILILNEWPAASESGLFPIWLVVFYVILKWIYLELKRYDWHWKKRWKRKVSAAILLALFTKEQIVWFVPPTIKKIILGNKQRPWNCKKVSETTSLKELVDKYFAPNFQDNQLKWQSWLNIFSSKERRFHFFMLEFRFKMFSHLKVHSSI